MANSNFFTLETSEKQIFDEKNIFLFISMVVSLEKIFDKKIDKLTVEKFNIQKGEININNIFSFIDNWQIKLITKIYSNEINVDKKIDKIYSDVKFLRNIFAHHDSYKKSENDPNTYILVSSYVNLSDLFLLVIKNDKDLMILKYSISVIKEKTEQFIKKLFD